MDTRNSYTGVGGNMGQGNSQTQGSQFRPVPETKDQVQAKTMEAMDKVQEKAGQAVGQVQQQAQSALTQQKEQASEGLNGVAGALRQTGQSLREQGQQEQFAQFADKAADQVERFSTFLRDKDLGEITHEVERFARKEPAIFLGGALALGLLGTRFLRSSSQRAQQMQNRSRALSDRASYSGGYSSGSYGYREGSTQASPYADTGNYERDYGYGDGGVGRDFETGTGLGARSSYETGSGDGSDTDLGTQSGYRAATDTDMEAGYSTSSTDTDKNYETGVIYTQKPYMGASEEQRRKGSLDGEV